jgi:hypothetical protein
VANTKPRRTTVYGRIKTGSRVGLLLLFCPFLSFASHSTNKIICRPELARSHRAELAGKLRQITGWQGLDFDENGVMRLGDEEPLGGSETARKLVTEASSGKNIIVLEDASNRQDVAFCRVVEGRWKMDAANKPPVFVVMIDFADFSHVMGDKAALASFNVGWGALHEIEHVVHDLGDPSRLGEAGECEGFINQMRRECGLAERADYFFTLLPGTTDSAFITKFVRIAFDLTHPGTNKKERHWLIWDAKLVGGLDEQRSMVARL